VAVISNEKNEGQVLQSNISRRVAGIWFLWSVAFDWFDERERQDRPAHQINGPESLFAACPDNSTFTIQGKTKGSGVFICEPFPGAR
jgi:hypothetical protein